MKKLLITLLCVFAIGSFANAQSSDFKPSGNLWGYAFGDYYYMDVTVDVAYDSGSLEPIFDYVDVLVSRERSKIFPDMNIK